MLLLTKVNPCPATADIRQKAVFLHDSKHCFWISINISVFLPFPYSSITMSPVILFLTFFYLSGQFCILHRLSLSFYKVVVTTLGHTEKFTHDRYRVFVLVTIEDSILHLRPHIFSVDCRKSHKNIFSIFNFAISCS